MAEIVFITGGARSGKSAYAQAAAEGLPGPRAYLATCPHVDAEMAERIRRHRENRAASRWDTWEEPVDLAGALSRPTAHRVVLVDCLSLWINNLMYRAERRGAILSEDDASLEAERAARACAERPGTVLIVSNEVGLGIVPNTPAGRAYRDLLGRANQVFARLSTRAVLLVSGLPLFLKGGPR